MADWTTKNLSKMTEVDLHPDLAAFPVVIRNIGLGRSALLSESEAHELMLLLIEHFGGVYSTG